MQVSPGIRHVPARDARGLVVPDGGLVVPREGIRFRDVAPGLVRVWIDVVNQGPRRSKPAGMRIESAPLGAFVAWRPLREDLVVAPIAPGGTGRVSLTVPRRDLPALGGVRGASARSLLTAAGFDPGRFPSLRDPRRARDLPGLDGAGGDRLLSELAEACFDLWHLVPSRNSCRMGRGRIPPELRYRLAQVLFRHVPLSALANFLLFGGFDLDRPRPHWAGNLNVWIGGTPVERHRAPRLRIHAGRPNVATFFVGDGPDDYVFRLEGLSPRWECRLRSTTEDVTWATNVEGDPRWLSLTGRAMLSLVLHPPETCTAGEVVVHVTQRSTGREAAVEFDLDPEAPGPGCITV